MPQQVQVPYFQDKTHQKQISINYAVNPIRKFNKHIYVSC
jgi:hypothetical protein